MNTSIKHKFFFAHPPEVIWDFLTKPELMEQWLMKNDFQPILGLDFQFRTTPISNLDFDGIFYCKVLEIVPFKKLSYSWNSRARDGIIQLESIVTWTLEPKKRGTELFLEHSGFAKKENLDFYNSLMHGWVKKLHQIDTLLNAVTNEATTA